MMNQWMEWGSTFSDKPLHVSKMSSIFQPLWRGWWLLCFFPTLASIIHESNHWVRVKDLVPRHRKSWQRQLFFFFRRVETVFRSCLVLVVLAPNWRTEVLRSLCLLGSQWATQTPRNMAEIVEKSLELVGATAIEDKLQELRIPGP